MRRLRKAIFLILLVGMLCPCISMVADAAYAGLHFTDPSTTVGAEVEVVANFSSTSTSLQSLNAVLTYDTSMLRFVSRKRRRVFDGFLSEVPGASGGNYND